MIFKNIIDGIMGNVIYDFFKRLFQQDETRHIKHKINDEENENNVGNHITKGDKCHMIQDISQRFQQVIEMMNQGLDAQEYKVSVLAEAMGLKKASELYNYYNGTKEPTFKFMEIFSQRFGINPDWLKYGNGTPFKSGEASELFPYNYYKRIRELNPRTIYFVRSKSNTVSTGIVIGIDEFKYIYFPKVYYISSYVGGTGRAQILSFYELIRALKKDNYACLGRTITEEQFYDVFSGNVFPGVVKRLATFSDPWWDDFTDVYHQYSIAKNYGEWYGEEFIKAQKIVREEINQ